MHEAYEGRFGPLIEALRAAPLCADREVLNFVADFMDGKIKRPVGKPKARPERTWRMTREGAVDFVDVRDARRMDIVEWVRERRLAVGDAAYSEGAARFDIEEEALRNMVRRASNAWKRSRSR